MKLHAFLAGAFLSVPLTAGQGAPTPPAAPGRIRYIKEGVIEAGELEARVAEILKKP